MVDVRTIISRLIGVPLVLFLMYSFIAIHIYGFVDICWSWDAEGDDGERAFIQEHAPNMVFSAEGDR